MEILGSRNRRAMNSSSMVDQYLRSRGIGNERVLEAMGKTPRHHYVPHAFRENAYSDRPLPIGEDQTISQPYMVALMTQTLCPGSSEKILEIGTGSGYQAAILSHLSRQVFSVERIAALARKARRKLEDEGVHNVSVKLGNGRFGWDEFAPYDGVIVTASADEVPLELFQQVRDGGRVVIPLREEKETSEKLYLFRRKDNRWTRRFICHCSFVPFVT